MTDLSLTQHTPTYNHSMDVTIIVLYKGLIHVVAGRSRVKVAITDYVDITELV